MSETQDALSRHGIGRAPQVGDKVQSRSRMKGGRKMTDTGEVTRVSDGGYCVVRWDSDGASHEVPMMSLRLRGEG